MRILLILQDVLSTPAIFIGVMAMMGLIVQKKAITDVAQGTIKTIVGFLILSAGSAFLQTGSLTDFGIIFNYAFNLSGVIPNNEAIVTAVLSTDSTSTAWIMMFGMVANIVIARFSRLKYIFLTGHHTFYMAAMIVAVFRTAGLFGWRLILAGSLMLGFVMTLFPALVQSTMRKITGTDDFAFGHSSSIGCWFAAQIGKSTRRKGNQFITTEDISFPKGLSFLGDSTIAISITMIVIFLIITGLPLYKQIIMRL